MRLSILIASHNRSQSLSNFLRQLSGQVIPNGLEWEVVIIDNNSSDDTREIVQPFLQQEANRYKYIFEIRGSKSIALNTALEHATGEVFVFTDDDCIPDPYWLANFAREFSGDSALAVVGGRVELFNKQHRPVSIRTSPDRVTVSTIDDLFSLFIGCNMAIHRRVCSENFDPLLGPGARIPAIEDLDLLYRVFRREFKICYVPDVLVYHNHGRTTDLQIEALNRNYVIGRGAFYCKHILRGDSRILRMAYWEVSSLAKAVLKGLRRGKIDPAGQVLWNLLIGVTRRVL
jgi:glycosyltransferase involved in cell wall biosynthesis